MSLNKNNEFFTFLGGIAIGVGLGILFAPEKGSVTREKLKQDFDDLKDTIKSNIDIVSEESKDQFSSLKESFQEKIEDVLSSSSHKTEEVITVLEKKLAELKEKNAKYQK